MSKIEPIAVVYVTQLAVSYISLDIVCVCHTKQKFRGGRGKRDTRGKSNTPIYRLCSGEFTIEAVRAITRLIELPGKPCKFSQNVYHFNAHLPCEFQTDSCNITAVGRIRTR